MCAWVPLPNERDTTGRRRSRAQRAPSPAIRVIQPLRLKVFRERILASSPVLYPRRNEEGDMPPDTGKPTPRTRAPGSKRAARAAKKQGTREGCLREFPLNLK